MSIYAEIQMAKIKKIILSIIRILRITLIVCGSFFLLMVIMALTPLPFWARYNLGSSKDFVPENTKTIVVMGGGGFPSESVLMRLWYTKELALKFPESTIIVATPGDTLDRKSTVVLMKQELIKSGIDSSRIYYEAEGLNTRHQALRIHKLFESGNFGEPIVVVSSPEHLFRTVLCFEKAGFERVSGKSAHESMLETDLRLKGRRLGGNTTIPDVGNSISLRYKFWDYMKYEITVMREYIAIAYYKVKGWI